MFSAFRNANERDVFFAVFDGDLSMIQQFLASSEANAEVTNDSGLTLLHVAAMSGKLDVVQLLVDKGANVNAKADSGETPLHLAAANGHTDVIKVSLHLLLIITTFIFSGSSFC